MHPKGAMKIFKAIVWIHFYLKPFEAPQYRIQNIEPNLEIGFLRVFTPGVQVLYELKRTYNALKLIIKMFVDSLFMSG